MASAVAGTLGAQEHDRARRQRCRRHVAKIAQHVAREAQRIGRQREPVLHGIQDRTAAGMHGPQRDVGGGAIAEQCRAMFHQPAPDAAGYLAGEMHLEPLVADMPGDQIGGARDHLALKRSSAIPVGFRRDQACATAIAEQQEAEHLLELPLLLKMQAGKFQIDHQNLGSGSERTMWRASFSAFTAAKQPIKPTLVRSTDSIDRLRS